MFNLEKILMQFYIIYLRYVRDRLSNSLVRSYDFTVADSQPLKKLVRRINMNSMANTVALKEKGRTETNIAQIKEVMKIFLEELATYKDEEIIELVNRYKE